MSKTSCREITLEQYLEILDNPKQRNTELRAKSAKKKHLSEWHPAHSFVSASLFEGKLYLNDGHTRRELIRQGHFSPEDLPETYHLAVIECDRYEDVCDNYDCYDSKSAVESASDTNYSLFKHLGHEFKSQRFQKPTDLGAIHSLACDGTVVTREDWVRAWFSEVVELDRFDIPAGTAKGVGKTLTAGAIAAAVMLIHRGYGDKVRQFILDVRADRGEKKGQSRDGVQLFVEWILSTGEKTSGYLGYKNVAEKFIVCFDLWLKGHRRCSIPTATKKLLSKYLVIKSKGDK